MGRVLALPEMEIVNDELRNEGLVPRAQGSDWEMNVQGRSCEEVWLVLMGPRFFTPFLGAGSVPGRGWSHDPPHRWAILRSQPPEDACC